MRDFPRAVLSGLRPPRTHQALILALASTRRHEQHVCEWGAFGGGVHFAGEAEIGEERAVVGDGAVVSPGAATVESEAFAEPFAEASQSAASTGARIQLAEQDALARDLSRAAQELVLFGFG